jgi:hypothetical protein
MTQAKFAEALDVNQAEIFKIEHRTEIRAIFPIVRWRIAQFEELNSPVQVVATRLSILFARRLPIPPRQSTSHQTPLSVCSPSVEPLPAVIVSMIAIAP